jgi:hypothetical protein
VNQNSGVSFQALRLPSRISLLRSAQEVHKRRLQIPIDLARLVRPALVRAKLCRRVRLLLVCGVGASRTDDTAARVAVRGGFAAGQEIVWCWCGLGFGGTGPAVHPTHFEGGGRGAEATDLGIRDEWFR